MVRLSHSSLCPQALWFIANIVLYPVNTRWRGPDWCGAIIVKSLDHHPRIRALLFWQYESLLLFAHWVVGVLTMH